MLRVLNADCPFRPGTIRAAQFHVILTMEHHTYKEVVENISELCESLDWSNSTPHRVVDRLVESGHITFGEV